ncbi:uncharacterized protein LOC115058969 [Echeneis naucrates]|uniref:uncharacterized protein LOC115058969 n=1 Tax=Echeneis naucrates TaxID=173247 RepID=UPI0011144BFD|nr:uncharacterized protein LOC115058969 [Echeneis naucrates]
MKLLLSSLLLSSLCALSSWTVSSTRTLLVKQSPDVSITEGETVNISCCCTVKSERMRFIWKKNQTPQMIYHDNQTEGSQEHESYYCSTLTFYKITTNDSGTYVCNLVTEIPFYGSYNGNGTTITVRARENRGGSTDGGESRLGPLAIVVSILIPLLLITFICIYTLRRKQAQPDRMIYEVPHTDSEVAEMDKHSTSSSRGSSQWCQVPVYESFDYFERVQTKEGG